MREKKRYPVLIYIVMAIVGRDVPLIQVAMVCHRVPGPSGVLSYLAYIIPVVSGTRIVYHIVWVDLEGADSITIIRITTY